MRLHMKRILIFSLAYFPHVGGAEVAIKEITDRIPDIDFSLITLCMAGEAREEKMGKVQVYRVGNGASYFEKILSVPRAAMLAARLHRAHPFDAFWAMMSYMVLPITLLRWVGIRKPYLLTLQEGDPFEYMFNRPHILPFRPLLFAGFRYASVVQTISTYLAEWAKRAGYPGTPVVIGNGVDVAHFSHEHTRAELDTLARSLGKKLGDVFLITTSRLVKKNACDDVIRALPLLPGNVTFLILGIGPDEPMLRALANALGVEDRVHFLGKIGHEDLPKYLKVSDIFIRPSLSEGLGISFIEAMAAGLPVIATQEGGIADFLFDAQRNPDKETTGWAVDKNSPEQIATAVQDILVHPDKVEKVTATAKRLVVEKYDWNLIARQMQEVFNRVFTA